VLREGACKDMAAAVTPARSGGGVSPSSSPRLPSPPPMPELQFGPQSPLSGSAHEVHVDTSNKPDEAARRRIRPGTKAVDMANGPPLVPLNQVDSAFPLQEHLKALYAHLTHGQNSTHSVPITKESAIQIARPPQLEDGESADRNLWLYEICRFLTIKAGLVSCALMDDKPACSSQTCPEMRASEWQYLCAVHEPPKSCCAIDYVNHTLDWAANVLTSTKHFPSRLQLGGGEQGSAYQSMRQLTNIFRRVYRIFAHAWFQHQEVFWHIESTQGIYVLFKTVCDEYHLIPEDNYTIPPEAEGPREEAEAEVNPTPTEANQPPGGMQILRKDTAVPITNQNGDSSDSASSPPKDPVSAQTARRHRHTPSTGSHVTTIAEGTEEDDVPPVPPIPSSVSTASQPGISPGLASPDRRAREALGRLDISGTYLPVTSTAHVSDPLAAAGAAVVSPAAEQTPTNATASEAKTQPPQPVKLDTAAAVAPKAITEQDRRGSGFESEVRSPGGGSIRTAGPDLLSAIMGHMDDKEREEVLAGEGVLEEAPEREEDGKDAVEMDQVERLDNEHGEKDDGEETVLFVGADGAEGEKGNKKGEREEVAKVSAEQGEAQEAEEAAVGKQAGGDGDEDEDDNETMEEIKLPGSSPAKEKGKEAEA
jgi:hypothetical protein